MESQVLVHVERVALLKLCIRWLKCCRVIDFQRISKLERKIWLYKIKGVKVTQQVNESSLYFVIG